MDVTKLLLIDECATRLNGACASYLAATEASKKGVLGTLFRSSKSKVQEQLEIATAFGAFFQMEVVMQNSWDIIKLPKAKALEEVVLRGILLLCKDHSPTSSDTVDAVLAIHEKAYAPYIAAWLGVLKTKPSAQVLRPMHEELSAKIFSELETSLGRRFTSKYRDAGQNAASKFLTEHWNDDIDGIITVSAMIAPAL